MENIDVLINKARIEKRLDEMVKEIEKDYEGKEIVLLGILKGSVPFMWELAKRLKNNVIFEFIEVSSYQGTESTGTITLHKDIKSSIEGKDVIIVEDIVDTGRTLKCLKEELLKRNPASLKITCLMDKKDRRVVELDADYVCFDIPNKFVVGYGFDIDDKYRNIPYVGYIEE